MDTTLVIGTSVLLQVVAAVFALWQMRDLEMRRTWLAISAALILMSIPRSITLYRLVTGEITRPPDLEAELVALEVSFLMGIAIAYTTRLFQSLKRAQVELARSQQAAMDNEVRLRSLIDNAPDAIITSDKNGLILIANRATEPLTGFNCADLAGKQILDLTLFNSLALSRHAKSRSVSSLTGPISFEVSYDVERNRTVFAEVRGFEASIHDEPYQIWVARDVTEKKRMEIETDRLQEQLRHAERLQSVGTLAGGIAHDFNNILTPIVGYTQLAIKSSEEGRPAKNLLDNVIKGAMRAKDLVKQILAFSRQGEKQTIPVQLQPLLTETLTLLRASIPTTVTIESDVDPDCGVIIADPSQIHQVIMNLCINAAHAMRDSCGVLSVKLDQCGRDDIPRNLQSNLQNGLFARVTIRDTGCGMDNATLTRIFEPFFTTKSNGQGSGLGLSVAHGIITSHGGAISVESVVGKGTTFFVYLPLDLAPVQQLVITDVEPVRGTARVLVVDDEPDIVMLLGNMLSDYGFRVASRTSSIEALAAFRANPDDFDVVVTDQTMPHMTGVELTAELRRIRPEIPVIIMTGFSNHVMPANYRSFGLNGFLMKPILAGPITNMIHSVCQDEPRSLPAG